MIYCLCSRSFFVWQPTEAALDEIEILTTIGEKAQQTVEIENSPFKDVTDIPVVGLVDEFYHEGPHGKHMCMCFEVLGDNLLSLIKAYDYNGIPCEIVRQITRDVLIGLDFLHRCCGVIHTDIKPENVLINKLLPLAPKISDFVEDDPLRDPNGRSDRQGRSKRADQNQILDENGVLAKGLSVAELAQLDSVSGDARKKLKKKLRKKALKRVQKNKSGKGKHGSTQSDDILSINDTVPGKGMAAIANFVDLGENASKALGENVNCPEKVKLVKQDEPISNLSSWLGNICCRIPLICTAEDVSILSEKLPLNSSLDDTDCLMVFSCEDDKQSTNENESPDVSTSQNAETLNLEGMSKRARKRARQKQKKRMQQQNNESSNNSNTNIFALTVETIKKDRLVDWHRGLKGLLSLGRHLPFKSAYDTENVRMCLIHCTATSLLPTLKWLESMVSNCRFFSIPPGLGIPDDQHELSRVSAVRDCFKKASDFRISLPNSSWLLAGTTLEKPLQTLAKDGGIPVIQPLLELFSEGKQNLFASIERRIQLTGYASGKDTNCMLESHKNARALYDLSVSEEVDSAVAQVLDKQKQEEEDKDKEIEIQYKMALSQWEKDVFGFSPSSGETAPRDENGNVDAGVRAKIVDLGNACWVDKHFSEDIQTRQYRSPEVIIGAGYDCVADVWSNACMVFELLTGDLMFDPQTGDGYSRDEDHLAQIQELLGLMPSDLAMSGKYSRHYFRRDGQLRHIPMDDMQFWGPSSVLHDKYGFPLVEANLIEDFLLPQLLQDPDKRIPAQLALEHVWMAPNLLHEEAIDSFVEEVRNEQATEVQAQEQREEEGKLSTSEQENILNKLLGEMRTASGADEEESPMHPPDETGKFSSPGNSERSYNQDDWLGNTPAHCTSEDENSPDKNAFETITGKSIATNGRKHTAMGNANQSVQSESTQGEN